MDVTLGDFFSDPALFLFELDQETAIFQTMTRENFARSIFLDGRIRHGNAPNFRVPMDVLLKASQSTPGVAPPTGWIFHVAQCGSTLLARALDHIGRSLVLREPMVLRRLGVAASGGTVDGRVDGHLSSMLRLTLAMLGKRWDPATPVIVKANVPVNFIAREVMEANPDCPAILLYFPLESYVAAILRTEGHVRWTEGVFDELRLSGSPLAAHQVPDSAATKAAALWFAQMKAYAGILADFPAARSLDAATFFARPAETIDAAAALFGVPLRPGEAEAIVAGELFHSYSKNPALDYDPEVRAVREIEARRRLADPISEAVEWARRAGEIHGLPVAFDKSILGESPALLP